jgi:hypothetical protein
MGRIWGNLMNLDHSDLIHWTTKLGGLATVLRDVFKFGSKIWGEDIGFG